MNANGKPLAKALTNKFHVFKLKRGLSGENKSKTFGEIGSEKCV